MVQLIGTHTHSLSLSISPHLSLSLSFFSSLHFPLATNHLKDNATKTKNLTYPVKDSTISLCPQRNWAVGRHISKLSFCVYEFFRKRFICFRLNTFILFISPCSIRRQALMRNEGSSWSETLRLSCRQPHKNEIATSLKRANISPLSAYLSSTLLNKNKNWTPMTLSTYSIAIFKLVHVKHKNIWQFTII